MAKITKTSILLYPNVLKKSKKSYKIPIYLRLYHQGKKSEKNLNKYITEKDLNLWNKELSLLINKNYNINTQLG